MGLIGALIVSTVLSFVYYFTGMLNLSYSECLILALMLSTVDTEQSTSEKSKAMALVTNTVLILLI